MRILLLLFLVVPAVELALLIEVGRRLGTVETLALIVVTGVIGAALARWQGLVVLRRIQAELADGRLPGAALVDGVVILVAGALLITPGLLTDGVGFLLLMPAVRRGLRGFLRRRFEHVVWRRTGRRPIVIEHE